MKYTSVCFQNSSGCLVHMLIFKWQECENRNLDFSNFDWRKSWPIHTLPTPPMPIATGSNGTRPPWTNSPPSQTREPCRCWAKPSRRCPDAVAQSVASALRKTEQVGTWIKSRLFLGRGEKGEDLGFGVKEEIWRRNPPLLSRMMGRRRKTASPNPEGKLCNPPPARG